VIGGDIFDIARANFKINMYICIMYVNIAKYMYMALYRARM